MLTLIPLSGLGDVAAQNDPVDELINEVTETLCPLVPGLTLPSGESAECPQGQLWLNHYNGPMGNTGNFAGDYTNNQKSANAVSPDGTRVFAIGASSGCPHTGHAYLCKDYVTLAYDAQTGLRLWETRYSNTLEYGDNPQDIGVSPDGGTVFVTGASRTSEGFTQYATVAYDAETGDELWAQRGLSGRASGLAVSADGARVIVTGSAASGDETGHATVAYDTVTGDELWVQLEPRSAGMWAPGIAISPDGSTVFLNGCNRSDPAVGPFYANVVAYDAATGETRWEAIADSRGCHLMTPAVSPDGSTLFIGEKLLDRTKVITAYDTETGEVLWSTATGFYLKQVSSDGALVFVSGNGNYGGPGGGYGAVAYETEALDAATGDLVWSAYYVSDPDADVPQWPTDLALTPEHDTVIVTGLAGGASGLQVFGTVGYDAATGEERWALNYDRGSYHIPNSIAMDPAGERFYVTGVTHTQTTGADITTIAYPLGA